MANTKPRLKCETSKPSMVPYTCNPSAWKVEARVSKL